MLVRNNYRELVGRDARAEIREAREHEAAVMSGLKVQAGDRDDKVDGHSRAYVQWNASGGRAERRGTERKRTQERSIEAYVASSLWANMFNLTLAFGLGNNVTLEADDPHGPAARVLAEMKAEDGNLITNARLWCLRLMLFGEIAAPVTISQRWGKVTFQQWHPFDVLDVKFRNGDDARPDRVMLAGSQAFREGQTVLRPGGHPRTTSWHVQSEHIPIEDYRAKTGAAWWPVISLRPYGESTRSGFDTRIVGGEPLLDGLCLYDRWDYSVDSFGLPAYIQSLDFVLRYNRGLYDLQWREELKRNFVWRGVIPGADPKLVESLNKGPKERPVPGTIVWTNSPDGGLFPMTHSLDAQDSETFFRLIKTHIIQACGLPQFFFAEHDANRATTANQMDPAIKVLEDAQNRYVAFLSRAVKFRLHTAKYWNAIPPQANCDFRVVVPKLSFEDSKRRIDTLEALARTLRLAYAAGAIHQETMALVIQKELEAGGYASAEEILIRLGKYGKLARVPTPPLPEPMPEGDMAAALSDDERWIHKYYGNDGRKPADLMPEYRGNAA